MADSSESGRNVSSGMINPAGGEPEKAALSPVAEALAKQAAMRKPRTGIHRVGPIQVTPKVKVGRKNRRRIPK